MIGAPKYLMSVLSCQFRSLHPSRLEATPQQSISMETGVYLSVLAQQNDRQEENVRIRGATGKMKGEREQRKQINRYYKYTYGRAHQPDDDLTKSRRRGDQGAYLIFTS